LVEALKVSHNRSLPHWYRHSQYHTTEHRPIGTGIESFTEQCIPHSYRHSQYHTTEHCHISTGIESITQRSSAILVQALVVSQNKAPPHWYRHSQYHTKEHHQIGTDTDNITKQCRLCSAVAPILCTLSMKALIRKFCSPVFMLQTLRRTYSPDQILRWLRSDI